MEAKFGNSSVLGKGRTSDNEDDLEDESSDSEEEDEDGELVTEALDSEIFATLNAIRTKDPRVYDKNAVFYSEVQGDDSQDPDGKKEKPMTIRDYHRKNLLNGIDPAEGEEAPKTFVEEQEDLRQDVLREMNAAVSKDESDDNASEEGGFLIAKPTTQPESQKKDVDLDVENAEKDPEKFLSAFLSSRAWVPTGSSRFQPLESDDDDDDQRAEAFEEAYNFRFEDPNKMNEKLLTHARDMTNQLSVRREEKSSRKKRREAERLKKEEEKKEREAEKSRLRKLKLEELEEKISKIKEAAGLKANEFANEDWMQFLDDKWDDSRWDEEMQKRFGDDYYKEGDADFAEEDEADMEKKRHLKKPTWEDEIDITDLVPDYKEEEKIELTESGSEADAKSQSKKSYAQEKREKKRENRKERRIVEEAVERTIDLEPNLLPGATRKNASYFRYRETSPQSFGLTARDILMADDSQLNQFVGLKKLASFRDPEKKRRDQKKIGKKARLRQWRKDIFGDEEGPKGELLPAPESGVEAPPNAESEHGMNVDIREGGTRKKRKRSRK